MEESSRSMLSVDNENGEWIAETDLIRRPKEEKTPSHFCRLALGATMAVAMVVLVAKVSSGALVYHSVGESISGNAITLNSKPKIANDDNSKNKTANVEVQTDIAYGLHEVKCPEGNDQDVSAECIVNLRSIKDMIGTKKSDTLKFWWVYPLDAAKRKKLTHKTAAEEGFQLFGGYKYKWGTNSKCFALGTGNTLTLSHTAPVPKTKDWHQVTIKGLNYSHFAWVPPDKKSCEHGCFVYKNKLGQSAAMKVGAGRVSDSS